MKFILLDRFKNNLHKLPIEHQQKFKRLMPEFNAACEKYIANPGEPWPKSLRVSQMSSRSGIWEMTWSYSGPDGRATFRFIEINGEVGVEWRRVGLHDIYQEP